MVSSIVVHIALSATKALKDRRTSLLKRLVTLKNCANSVAQGEQATPNPPFVGSNRPYSMGSHLPHSLRKLWIEIGETLVILICNSKLELEGSINDWVESAVRNCDHQLLFELGGLFLKADTQKTKYQLY